MPMQIGWVDYSHEERSKVCAILKLLSENGAVDEIGIGTIRDGFSNLILPGFSTLQTRAKYYVLIPYLFALASERTYVRKSDVADWIGSQEREQSAILIANSPKDSGGIFGSVSGKELIRLPSEIYWSGLRMIEILRKPCSFEQACSVIYDLSTTRHSYNLKPEDSNSGPDDKDALDSGMVLFAPIMPNAEIKEFLKTTSILLTNREAGFLFDHFTQAPATRDSLASWLLQHPDQMTESFDLLNPCKMPAQLGNTVRLAQEFSRFISGASYLYNVIFSRETDMEAVDGFRKWQKEYHPINLDEVIAVSACSQGAAVFVKRFDETVRAHDETAARNLIIARERSIKHDRAKLSHLDQYEYSQRGMYKLEYRYRNALQILTDIQKGLAARK